jgi:HrpA-like RNA helicase
VVFVDSDVGIRYRAERLFRSAFEFVQNAEFSIEVLSLPEALYVARDCRFCINNVMKRSVNTDILGAVLTSSPSGQLVTISGLVSFPYGTHFLVTQYDVDSDSDIVCEVKAMLSKQGHILCFLPSVDDCRDAMRRLQKENLLESIRLVLVDSNKGDFKVPQNVIQVLFAVEFCGTLVDLVAVIDTCRLQYPVFDPTNNSYSLVQMRVPKEVSHARKGLLGKTRPGTYIKFRPDRKEFVPEILRVDLPQFVLILRRYQTYLEKVRTLPTPPDPDKLRDTLNMLYHEGAINSTGELTATGGELAGLPPFLGDGSPRVPRLVRQ